MARIKRGIVTYDDTKLMRLLDRLEPGSRAYNFFVKDAMANAVKVVKPVMSAEAIAVGYPTAPGIRMTKGEGKSRPYKVWGRVPRAIRAGRLVLKRRDGGDTSQRVIVGAKLRGTIVGAPHANITRYSKNTERFTRKGYSRGKFEAMPFVQNTVQAVQGAVIRSFKKSYIKFAKQVSRRG